MFKTTKILIFMNSFIPVILILTPSSRMIFKKPQNWNYTIPEMDCLKNVMRESFPKIEKSIVTLTISEDFKTADIQNDVLEYLNKNENWTVQLLSEPPHLEFQSSENCRLDLLPLPIQKCRRQFILKEITTFYLIIIHTFTQLDKKLYSVYNSTSFNPSAEFLIHYRHSENASIAKMVPIFRKYLIFTVVVVDFHITENQTHVHVLQLKLDGPSECLEKSRFYSAGLCKVSGDFLRLRALFRTRVPKKFKNCTIRGIGMRYEPFVIDENRGFEIRLVHILGAYLNVTFRLKITAKSEDWGDKINGSWAGNFAEIYKSLTIGVGNVGPEADRIDDFVFTYSHFSATLVWVVPIAKYMRKWRVLTVIFSLNIWIYIFSILTLIAIFFYVFSNLQNDSKYIKTLSGSFLTSFQILLNSSVYKTPKTNALRLIFTTALIFALIMTCIYTSSLINVLTNIIREHQIDTVDEILASNLEIGGLEEYNERFRNPIDNTCVDELCKRYKYNEDENDTAQFWLAKVEEGVACTPLPRLFTQYYMTQTYEQPHFQTSSNTLYEDSERVKLFILRKPLNFYPVAIVMKKGNPFRKSFNKFLKRFLEAGLMFTLTDEYYNKFKKLEYFIENPDSGPEELNIYHMQGAFAIFAIGCSISMLVFIFEMCTKLKKNNKPTRVFNKNFHYDKKYGNMYGKNYPSSLQKKFI